MQKSNAFLVKRINDHVQYFNKIKGRLDNTNNFQPTDCHSCALGCWLDSDGVNDVLVYGEHMQTLFNRLVEEHEKFHIASHNAVQCHEQGDKVGEYREMTQMHKLSNNLIAILLEMDSVAMQQDRKAKSA